MNHKSMFGVSILFMLISTFSFAQVGIGTDTPNPSAILDVESTTKGILIPRMTQAERLAIPVDASTEGLLVYETDTDQGFWYYNGSSWNEVSSAAAGSHWDPNGDDIYNNNVGHVGIGTGSTVTAPLHVKGVTTVATTNENTIYENDFSSGSANIDYGPGNTCTTGSNIWNYDYGYADITFSSSCSQNQTLIEGNFTPATSSINISFDYYYGDYSSDDSFTITLYNETTSSVESTLMSLTSAGANTTFSGDVSVTAGHNYSIRFQYIGINDLGAEVDNIIVTENLPDTPGSYTFRLEDGTEAFGKVLTSDANGNAYWATPTTSSGGTIPSDGDWFVDGDDMYNENAGNVGIGVTVPLYKLHIEDDAAGSAALFVENTNTSGSASYGIHGITNASDFHGAAGVFGESKTAGDREIGVKGDYSLWGAAVAGIGWGMVDSDMPTLQDYGVWGAIDYPKGAGVYAWNKNTSSGTAYGAYVEGNFAVTGSKSASVPTTKGNQLVYSVESPEIWFEDYGTAKLVNGEIHLTLEDLFQETIFVDEEHPMHVFLQEEGDSKGLYVIIDEDGNGFTVKEKQGGTSNVAFSYTITAKRRFFQDHRFGVDGQQPFGNNLANAKYREPRSTDPAVVEQNIKRLIAEKEAKHAAEKAAEEKEEQAKKSKESSGKNKDELRKKEQQEKERKAKRKKK